MPLIRWDDDPKDLDPTHTFAHLSRIGRVEGRTRTTTSRVRDIRLARGYTQVSLAGHMHTTVSTIRKAERGYLAQLRMVTLLKLAVALDCGAADLFPILGARLDGG